MDIGSNKDYSWRVPTHLPEEHFRPGLKVLSNDPDAKSDTEAGSASNGSEVSVGHSASEVVEGNDVSTRHPHHDPAKWLMSWWPEPERLALNEGAEYHVPSGLDKKQQLPRNRRGSVLERLENRVSNLMHGHHGSPAKPTKSNGAHELVDSEAMPTMLATTAVSNTDANTLFHVVLTSSHFHKDVNSTVQTVRVCGTYAMLPAARAFAHRCLFDSGYEAEWFTSLESHQSTNHTAKDEEVVVRATGPDGDVFSVSVQSDTNLLNLQPNFMGRVETPLYHVVESIVHYLEDQSGQTRETFVKASFPSFDSAREYALTSVLRHDDGLQMDDFAEYDEAQPGEVDCGYGENVMVHAVGEDGKNYLVSVLKAQDLEAVRVMEAAMKMHS